MTDLQHRLTAHLQQIGQERDPFFASAHHFFVQQYVQGQLGQWGQVEAYDFEFKGRTHRNWLLNLPGQNPGQAAILVGAHYDSVPGSPGADDNASGVAVLLELARALAAQPPRRPVRLVAFDLEEMGLVGSRHYAETLAQRQEPLYLMLSLEMLGYRCGAPHSQQYPPGLRYIYPNRGDYIAQIGNWPTIPAMVRLWQEFRAAGVRSQWLPVIRQGYPVPATRRSDHAPFWDLGYRAIMVTDTADLRNPHYHQATDTLDTLDLAFLTQVCQGLINGIRNL